MTANQTNQAEITAELRLLAAEIIQANPDEIEERHPLGKYGITSIELIDFVRRIERRYAISFQPDKLKEITLGALAENVYQAVDEKRQ